MTRLHEFDIIQRFFTKAVKNSERFPLGVGDDAALIAAPAGQELATSIDTILAGTHFPEGSDPYDIGHKSLAVSLSDLAAMGAEPAAVLLAMTLPEANEKWLAEFASGFFNLAEEFEVELIGGNMTRGHLSISTVVYGWVPAGKAIRRSGAKPNDRIYVTGNVGDAGFALQQIQQQQEPLEPEFQQRFFHPYPQIKAGLALRSIATAAIDVSDGLAADLSKLLTASRVGGRIQTNQLPISDLLRNQTSLEQAITLALTGGEDYELCFTAPADSQSVINKMLADLDCPVHAIGHITAEPGLKIFDADGKEVDIPQSGYQHF